MNAHKAFVLFVFALQHLVGAVDFADFLHHIVHILNLEFGIRHILRHESLFAEEALELLDEVHILDFLLVEIAVKLHHHLFGPFLDVVVVDAQLLAAFVVKLVFDL